MEDAGWYLPDFYFPEWKSYVEIKPDAPTKTELRKMWELAKQSNEGRDVDRYHYLFCGSPGSPKLVIDKPNSDGIFEWSVKDGYVILGITGRWLERAPHVVMQCFCMRATDGAELDINNMLFPDVVNPPCVLIPKDVGEGPKQRVCLTLDGFIDTLYVGPGRRYYDQRLLKAYQAGRSARFEHGEKGATSGRG